MPIRGRTRSTWEWESFATAPGTRRSSASSRRLSSGSSIRRSRRRILAVRATSGSPSCCARSCLGCMLVMTASPVSRHQADAVPCAWVSSCSPPPIARRAYTSGRRPGRTTRRLSRPPASKSPNIPITSGGRASPASRTCSPRSRLRNRAMSLCSTPAATIRRAPTSTKISGVSRSGSLRSAG